MGYEVERLRRRGYLLRYGGAPVAVVHPLRDVSQFSRLTDNGELPEGTVLATAVSTERIGACWPQRVATGCFIGVRR